jgi:hypothetical protein
VRRLTVADWSEDHMFKCLAWLYDGFPLPGEAERSVRDVARKPG